MSELVKKYNELSLRLGDEDLYEKEESEIVKQMAELKKQFKESDWNELIHSVPIFMRPMVQKQKEKHLQS